MGQLGGKAAIVTGAGTGLGAATAELFAREGASVVLVGRRAEKLNVTAGSITAAGGRAEVVAGDVALESTAQAAAARCTDEFGAIDVLINNAGIHAHPQLVHEIPLEEWERFMAIDLRGPFLFTKAVIPSMIERGGGAIVNVSSMVALVGFKYGTAYAAAKAGLIALSRGTAVDYAEHGIRANCLCPGGMEPVEGSETTDLDRARLAEAVAASGGAPLARMAHVDEVAQLLLTMVGPACLSMTGSTVTIDGGFTAH
jgi:NAD(P)-dependent dehydrogenase (short-subunit alcohol dehydrogenase family)